MIYGLLLEHLHNPGYFELGDRFQKYIRGGFLSQCCTNYMYNLFHSKIDHI